MGTNLDGERVSTRMLTAEQLWQDHDSATMAAGKGRFLVANEVGPIKREGNSVLLFQNLCRLESSKSKKRRLLLMGSWERALSCTVKLYLID